MSEDDWREGVSLILFFGTTSILSHFEQKIDLTFHIKYQFQNTFQSCEFPLKDNLVPCCYVELLT